jgi:hypothetical protein
MKVSIHQPNFWGWAGYWHKIWSADVHVAYTGVKIDYEGYQRRVKIRDRWCGVSVTSSRMGLLKEATFNVGTIVRYKDQAIASLLDAPYINTLQPLLYGFNPIHTLPGLAGYNTMQIAYVNSRYGKKVFGAVDDVVRDTHPTEKLGAVLKKFDATTYLCGQGAKNYLVREKLDPELNILIQIPRRKIPDCSILQLIAEEPDPVDFIMTGFRWVSWDEYRAGDSPAL